MHFLPYFFIASSGLFDFDLTFLAEASLFFILSLVITFLFLSPISNQINSRSEFINYNLTKSALFLFFGNKNMQNLIFLACKESNELQRQMLLLRNNASSAFEKETLITQNENFKILAQFRKNLVLKSAFSFLNFKANLNYLTDQFFLQKFNLF